MNRREPVRRPACAGYSLVELMVVVAIIAIIAAIAVPHYRHNVVEGCRVDARIALENVAAAQEKFYFNANRYASSVTSLAVAATSPEGIYTLTTGLNGDGNTFIATAVPSAAQGCLPAGDFHYRITHTGLRQRNEGGGWISGWD